MSKLKKIEEGFTIVETLIVLAIAALIITIVLIAVPDLQRSARNTDILHDAQNIATAVNTYESSNQGATPATITKSGDVVTLNNTAGNGTEATAQIQGNDYFSGNEPVGTGGLAAPAKMSSGELTIYFDGECTTTFGATSAYNPRAVAIFYPIENGNGTDMGCQQG